ncbi:hypothetical protein MOV58_05640 [Staphylococcus hominis]|uniref:hypothetical protein n=1 Tax=Staphylococcus hominis TaxID=1290 RepID=UPI0010D0A58E|nr:hypothetical protein [Staphylococcus hominis]MCI2852830.1 hypothetical protein [Staphylococcus hominis]TBW92703.1 hypothetical protein EQ808_05290 [Staphylococcus hominis]UNQ69059.1 hypothetical protein MOV58_05640 [Staphylococcus hominis]
MAKRTITIDVDENLLVTANSSIANLLYEIDDDLMSSDDEDDNRDLEEQRDALKYIVKMIDKLLWGE